MFASWPLFFIFKSEKERGSSPFKLAIHVLEMADT